MEVLVLASFISIVSAGATDFEQPTFFPSCSNPAPLNSTNPIVMTTQSNFCVKGKVKSANGTIVDLRVFVDAQQQRYNMTKVGVVLSELRLKSNYFMGRCGDSQSFVEGRVWSTNVLDQDRSMDSTKRASVGTRVTDHGCCSGLGNNCTHQFSGEAFYFVGSEKDVWALSESRRLVKMVVIMSDFFGVDLDYKWELAQGTNGVLSVDYDGALCDDGPCKTRHVVGPVSFKFSADFQIDAGKSTEYEGRTLVAGQCGSSFCQGTQLVAVTGEHSRPIYSSAAADVNKPYWFWKNSDGTWPWHLLTSGDLNCSYRGDTNTIKLCGDFAFKPLISGFCKPPSWWKGAAPNSSNSSNSSDSNPGFCINDIPAQVKTATFEFIGNTMSIVAPPSTSPTTTSSTTTSVPSKSTKASSPTPTRAGSETSDSIFALPDLLLRFGCLLVFILSF